MDTGYSSEVVRCKKQDEYPKTAYRILIPRILYSIKYTGDARYLSPLSEKSTDIIEFLFCSVFPAYGLAVRPEQIRLCKSMYLGLIEKRMSLCEAEVGTGKTLAYLVAGLMAQKRYDRLYGQHNPVTIATSSIELQQSIVEREIPKLSEALIEYGMIQKPLSAVLRKGKEHYFCLLRYQDYLNKIQQTPQKYENLISQLTGANLEQTAFDLDRIEVPSFVKSRICVKESCFC